GRPRGEPGTLGDEAFRRSIYVQVRRSMPLAVLETFDAPIVAPCCDHRTASTVTPQALLLMNSDFILEQAGHFAARVRHEAGENASAQVARAWRLAFVRAPSAKESTEAIAFLNDLADHFRKHKPAKGAPDPRQQALATFCQALLGCNEFLYVD